VGKTTTRKPKKYFKPSNNTHGFFLEDYGTVTCECDHYMTYARSAKDAKKISEWFLKVSKFLKKRSNKK